MLKKITLILFAVLLVLSFAACSKTKDSDETSSPDASSVGDPTQDYNKDEFDESPMDNDELEDLWNDNFSNEDAEIIPGGSKPSNGSTSGNSSNNSSTTSGNSGSSGSTSNSGSASSGNASTGSSSAGSSSTDSSNDSTMSGASGSIGFYPDAIF